MKKKKCGIPYLTLNILYKTFNNILDRMSVTIEIPELMRNFYRNYTGYVSNGSLISRILNEKFSLQNFI